jgi:KaiC/GvpD/RAD55 family RecA-like ATPase
LDCDNIPKDELENAKQAVAAKPYVFATGLSVSRNGLWALIAYEGTTDLKESITAIQPDFPYKIDTARSDECGLRYVTYDPDMIVKDEVYPIVSVEETIEDTSLQARRMIRSFDEISTEPTKWFLYNKIPADDISIISGDGAVGKTYFICFLASHVTRGTDWPDGHSCEMASAVFFPPEGNEGTFKRRLLANDVDLSKCRIQTGGTVIDKKTGESYIDPIFLTDWEAIERGIDETEQETGYQCRLLVVDPVMSFTAGKNPNRDNEVRELLDPIGRVLQRKKVTMLLLMHHSKSNQGSAQSLISTSVGWVNRARAVWQIHKDMQDTDLRYFVPTDKTNDCINPTAWSFRIKSPSPDVWEGKVTIEDAGLDKTANDIVYEQRQANTSKRGRPSKQLACEVRLMEILQDRDMSASDIMELLKAEEFGESTIRAAKKSLGVKSIGKGANTLWHLPTDTEAGNDSDVENVD